MITAERLADLAAQFANLRIAVLGDFCLDRYLEIDPAHAEISIETGLPVHNVVRVRAQPGAAGTIVNNLVALGVGVILPIGFCGEDGEGYELLRALRALPGVRLDHFLATPLRRTFTYCKPLLLTPGAPPQELSRLDTKNWSATPQELSERLGDSLAALANAIDGLIVMDQVDRSETGVVTSALLARLETLDLRKESVPVIADSRRGLRGFPRCIWKMNAAELGALTALPSAAATTEITAAARELARQNGRSVFVTLAERGLIGVSPDGAAEHVPARPLRGPIDVVGAGDSVTANLCAALAGGATLREALQLAALASSVVVHQLGTSGSASFEQMRALLAET